MRIRQISEGPLAPVVSSWRLRWIAGFLFELHPFRLESFAFEGRRYCGRRCTLAGTFARPLRGLHRDAAGRRAILPLLIVSLWL